MAVKTVPQSASNVAPDQLIYELTVIVNDLSAKLLALEQKLDLDGGVTDADYESTVGTSDTIAFSETGTPT